MATTNNSTTMSDNSLLEAKDISHSFDYLLFKDIDFTLQQNESVAIIGTSGSGKSTLLNIFSSLLTPNKGEIYYNNANIYNLSHKKLLEIRKNDFVIIFQAHYLFRGFNSSENLHITELLNDTIVDEKLLKKLKIDHILSQGIGELSGGQQQRLSCARVLTKKPKVIFADEPTGNLDKDTADELIDILFDYIKMNNGAMVMVTHDQNIAFKCDKVYKLIDYKLERLQ